MVVKNQNDLVRIITVIGTVISPLILAYIAAFGPTKEEPKDRFTNVVSAAIAEGDFDLARRLIDAVDPPKEGGK
jgi:predicted membrane protein